MTGFSVTRGYDKLDPKERSAAVRIQEALGLHPSEIKSFHSLKKCAYAKAIGALVAIDFRLNGVRVCIMAGN